MFDAIDHVIIAVRDLDAAARDYSSLLGRQPFWRGQHPRLGTANVLFALENTSVELLAAAGPGPVSTRLQDRLDGLGEGLFALAFATADARACADRLRSRQFEASAPIAGEGHAVNGDAVRRWQSVYLPEEQTRGTPLFAIEREEPETVPQSSEVPPDTVSRLDHIVLLSPDADACIALYRDGFGLRLALDRTFEERGVRLLFFRVGGTTLEVGSALAGKPEATDRLWGLAYGVENIDQARNRLSADGFEVSEVHPGRKRGTRVCTVRSATHGVATLLIAPDEGS